MGFPAEGDRGGDAAAAGAGRRRCVTRVGGTLRDDARSQPDHRAVVDVDGFYTIAGFSGHGFQHAPAAGRILADQIAGRDPKFDATPFELDRFSRRAVAGEGEGQSSFNA